MSSKNENVSNNSKDVNQIIINTNDINNNNTPLQNVYSNITSSIQSRKLSSLEEKLSSINTPGVEQYYKSLKTENQGVIPQVRRMELLQRKMNLLQNSSNQNSKALQEILEIEMKERLRYPKYTIIQNTPLTPHEDIVNEILKKKFGPGGGYSMNYPTVVFKNQEEINELKNKQNLNNNINNNNNNNNQGGSKVIFQSNENRPITVKMLKEIQQEILNLRKSLSELKIGVKEMKEELKMKTSDEEHKNSLMIEMMRKIIEDGGDTKLKASMENVLDSKKMDLNVVKTDLEIFKGDELINIIKEQINIYDRKKNRVLIKQFDEIKKSINENQVNANNQNKVESFEAFLKKEEEEKKESQKQTKKSSVIKEENEDDNSEEKEEEKSDEDKSSKSKTSKTKSKKTKSSKEGKSDDEEEKEENEKTSEKKSKTRKNNKKRKKALNEEKEEEEENNESKSKASKAKASKTRKNKKQKNKESEDEEDEEESDSKYTDNVSEIQTPNKAKSFASSSKGSKKPGKNNKKKKKEKSETISEKGSENDESEEESKSKSTNARKGQKENNSKRNNQKASSNKKSSEYS